MISNRHQTALTVRKCKSEIRDAFQAVRRDRIEERWVGDHWEDSLLEHDLCLAIVLAFLSIEAQGDYLLSF
jgi:hypothetical protein